MHRKFEAEVQQLDEESYVRLAGVIDEDNDLSSLGGHVRGHTVIVDLAGITEINNCGVRDWVRWLEGVQSKAQVVLVECSPALVAKLNLVSNFAGEAYLRSVYLPYFCQPCNAEKALLVTMDELPREGPVKAPVCRCDGCDGVMAFDDLEESYFAFVETAKRDIPDDLMQLLDTIAPAAGERKILSRIGGSSFAGLPSTHSGTGGGSDLRQGTVTSTSTSGGGGTGTSRSSAAALRRLREKTSLRTHRLIIDDLPDEASLAKRRRNRNWLIGFAIAATLLGVGLAVVVAIY